MLLNQEKPSVVNLSQPNKIMNTDGVFCFKSFKRSYQITWRAGVI